MNLKVLFFILIPLFAISQSPQKINIQSNMRNTNGEVVANKSVSLKISILSGSTSGSSVYSETHTKTTDISGLISLQIGNGTALSGVFANISWGNSPHFIKLEADFSGGSNYVLLGTQELMSVPYALYASKTDTSVLNLASRFNSKVNTSDTASILINYRNELNNKLNTSDTFFMLSNYWTGLNNKVSISDTSNMLNPYLRTANAVKPSNTSGIDGIYSWENPEGLSTDIVNFQTDIPYTVPNGKNLYLTSAIIYPLVNGIPYGTDGSTLLFPEGTIIQGCYNCTNGLFDNFYGSPPSTPFGFTGFLVNKSNKIIPVLIPLNDIGMNYTVPTGKILVLLSGTGQGYPICIGSTWYQNFTRYWLFNEGTTIKICNSTNFNPPRPAFGYTGYLIDK
jgi:hypothetical protein